MIAAIPHTRSRAACQIVPVLPELRLIAWPFHNGLPEVGMGAGAALLARDARLRERLQATGTHLSCEWVQPVEPELPEAARIFELLRRLTQRVAIAVDQGARPLVLAGNCISCLGTLAGAGGADLGVVWFDAHSDFDDPNESISGFLDAMGLAMLTGRGWSALRATIPGLTAVDEAHVVLAGVRDLEPHQRTRLQRSQLRAVPGAIDHDSFADAIAALAGQVPRVYVHVDLDALDASEARANEYAANGGPRLEHLLECIALCSAHFDVAAAAISAYDPTLDHDRRTLAAAREIGAGLAAALAA